MVGKTVPDEFFYRKKVRLGKKLPKKNAIMKLVLKKLNRYDNIVLTIKKRAYEKRVTNQNGVDCFRGYHPYPAA